MSSRLRRGARVGAMALVALIAAHVLAALVPLPARLAARGSPVVTYADGLPAHVFLSPDERWRVPVALERVDPDYVTALVALEDARFAWHPGVDPLAVLRAAVGNARAGAVRSGASTLTMQLVRLVEPRPRTVRSKAVEALRAAQLELRWGKREILEAYLTFTPYGRNVEGIESASWAYFGHGADALTAAEICTLLAVPQNPNARYPTPAHATGLKAARDEIAARLLEAGALPVPEGRTDADLLAEVVATPVPTGLRPPPRAAPHAARRVIAGRDRAETTLDRGVQAMAERTLASYRSELSWKGIHSASIAVVDHRTGEIVALVGSPDFWDEAHGGQIAAFDVPRSPGSALKPFLYAIGIDRGLVLPDFLEADVPIRYGTYAPENYDGRFDGLVRLEEALSRSLNIPFVNLLSHIGVEPFLGTLRGAGARHLDPRPGHYGLSAAIGGIELTPLEMAGLYAMLAEDGLYRPLRLEPGPASERRVLSSGAAWHTRQALSLRDRPDFPSRANLSSAPRRIHWKTGTSFGNRDAWAIGSGQRYTVAVWTGNVDNSPSPHLVGAEVAGPILFDLLEGLKDAVEADPRPPELVEVAVCALSGRPAGDACPHRRTAHALADRVPTAPCPYHQAIEVEAESGLAVRPGCRDGRETRLDSYVVWPANVRRHLSDTHRRMAALPAPAEGCEAHVAGGPAIVSPGPAEVLLLIPGLPAEEQEVAFEADAAVADARMSWFVDGAWLGDADGEGRVWWTPRPGRHEIVVVDGAGRADRQWIEVRGWVQ